MFIAKIKNHKSLCPSVCRGIKPNNTQPSPVCLFVFLSRRNGSNAQGVCDETDSPVPKAHGDAGGRALLRVAYTQT